MLWGLSSSIVLFSLMPRTRSILGDGAPQKPNCLAHYSSVKPNMSYIPPQAPVIGYSVSGSLSSEVVEPGVYDGTMLPSDFFPDLFDDD
mmetsp:Transcript_22145/g.51074  ORF Transcript_22145/g.51074 Transcript_22145/m.51074 type:complete len:89 (-) Transcript_22145:122-388(-)